MTEPNDQLGNVRVPPWAGLWLYEHENFEESLEYPVGQIVVIQPVEDDETPIVVDMFEYETMSELQEAWLTMERTVERSSHFFEEPEDPGEEP